MKQRRVRRGLRVILAGGVGALAFAALTSVGAAVSPLGTSAATVQYPEKVTICHKTGSKKNPFVTIRVSRNAVKAHLRHGDSVGSCSTARFTVCHKGKAKKVKGAKATAKHLRHGDRFSKCKKKDKGKQSERGKGSDKQKGKSEQKGKSSKGKPADTPGKGGEKGKPADTPGKGGEKGKKE